MKISVINTELLLLGSVAVMLGKYLWACTECLKCSQFFSRFQPPEGGVRFSPRRAQRPGRQPPWQGLGLRLNEEHGKVTKLWNCEVRSGRVPYFGWSDFQVVTCPLQGSPSLPEKLN